MQSRDGPDIQTQLTKYFNDFSKDELICKDVDTAELNILEKALTVARKVVIKVKEIMG